MTVCRLDRAGRAAALLAVLLLALGVARAENPPGHADAPDPAQQPVTEQAAPPPAADASEGSRAEQAVPAPAGDQAPDDGDPASTMPATAPTTQALNPRAILGQFAKWREQKQAIAKVAYFPIDKPFTERESDLSFFLGLSDAIAIHDLRDRLRAAGHDSDIRAVLLTLGPGTSVGLTQAMALRDSLADLRRAGKRVFVHADGFDTSTYVLASGATDICMLPAGDMMMPGVGVEVMFYRGTLDKLGVKADYIQIGEYKGADEAMTRTQASPELEGELHRLTESLFREIVSAISGSRSLSAEKVRQAIDETMLGGRVAAERGLVDHLIDQDGLRALIADELGEEEVELVRDYGARERPKVDFSNPFTLLMAFSRKPASSGRDAVAVIYATGAITDGEGDGGLLGSPGVGSEPMRRTLREALRDEKVKAVVLRIDSPGGSALASEVIWQAARRVAAEKPLVISIGGMAASGGYYIASAGDYIVAEPAGIVGSIGVVGGKLVMGELFEKIGLNTQRFTQGRNADLFSLTEEFNDRQKRMLRRWMQQTYDTFVERIMTTRQGRISDIDKVARGRIFVARDALGLGMVDELGGLDVAIRHAALAADLEEGAYDVRNLPEPKTLIELLAGGGSSVRSPLAQGAGAAMAALPEPGRTHLRRWSDLASVLERRPVALLSPFVISVR